MAAVRFRVCTVVALSMLLVLPPVASFADETLSDEIQVAWPDLRPVLPEGERGTLYAGETVYLLASGQIDRNHHHNEYTVKTWIFSTKRVVEDWPNFVSYANHRAIVALKKNGSSGNQPMGVASVLSLEGMPLKIEGNITDTFRLHAMVPNQPVAIIRERSFGAYVLTAKINPATRMPLIRAALQASPRRTSELRAESFFNRRLIAECSAELAIEIVAHYRKFYQLPTADKKEAESLLLFALELDPRNPVANAAIGDVYVAQGSNYLAQQQYLKSIALMKAKLNTTSPGLQWLELGKIERKLAASLAESYKEIGIQEALRKAEYWYGDSANSFENAGSSGDQAAALRAQAEILNRRRLSGDLDKARRVLQQALAISPDQVYGDFLGSSPDGRWLALQSNQPRLVLRSLEGKVNPISGMTALGTDSIIAEDVRNGDLLLRDANKRYFWWNIRKGLESADDLGLPSDVVQAVANKRDVLAVTASGLVYASHKESPVVRFSKIPVSQLQSKVGLSLNDTGWVALTTTSSQGFMSSTTTIEIYDAARNIVRTEEFKTELTPDLFSSVNSDDKDAALKRFLSLTMVVPEFVSLNDAGDLLFLRSNLTNPTNSQWVLSKADGTLIEVVTSNLPEVNPPPVGARFKGPNNSWSSRFFSLTDGAPSRLRWWASGQDVRKRWTQGSFSPDGKQIVISNLGDGITVFSAKDGARLTHLPLRKLTIENSAPFAMPLGHTWTGADTVLVMGLDGYGGEWNKAWLVHVDLGDGATREYQLDEDLSEGIIALGDAQGNSTCVEWDRDSPVFVEQHGYTISLFDTTRNQGPMTVSLRNGTIRARTLVLNSGLLISDTQSLDIAKGSTGPLSLGDENQHPNLSFSAGTNGRWIATQNRGISDKPAGPVLLFSEDQWTKTLNIDKEFTDDVQVTMEIYGTNIVLWTGQYADSKNLVAWYDPFGTLWTPLRFRVFGNQQDVIGCYSANGNLAMVFCGSIPGEGVEGVWAETSTGQFVVFYRGSPDRRVSASIVPGANGTTSALLVREVTVTKEGWLFTKEKIKDASLSLFQLNSSLVARVVPLPAEISKPSGNPTSRDWARFDAAPDYQSALISLDTDKTTFGAAIDLTTGKLLWKESYVSAVAQVGAGVLMRTVNPGNGPSEPRLLLWSIRTRTSQ